LQIFFSEMVDCQEDCQPEALYLLASATLNSPHPISVVERANAIAMLEHACEHGHIAALAELGFDLATGNEGPEKVIAGRRLVSQMAGMSNADTRTKMILAECFRHGHGGPLDMTRAAEIYAEASDEGCPRAKHALALCLMDGTGVPEDVDRAAELFEEAAEAGHAPAQLEFANCLLDGKSVRKDKRRAFEMLSLIRDEFPEAKHLLAICHSTGQGTPQAEVSATMAVMLWEEAYADGHAESGVRLALCALDGWGLPQDDHKAIELLSQVVKNFGHLNATYLLAECHAMLGTPEDEVKAAAFFEKAAGLEPIFQFAMRVREGREIACDPSRAFGLFGRGADGGDLEAKCMLADCHFVGCGTPIDTARAAQLWGEAIEAGHAVSLVFLADLLYSGSDDVPKDEGRAIRLLSEAADGGGVEAKFALTELHRKYDGVLKDDATAFKLLEEALDGGYTPARSSIATALFYGIGTPKDEARAAALAELDVAEGFTHAQTVLAVCLLEGRGIAKDEARGIEVLTAAATTGASPLPESYLAECLVDGRGVAEDRDEGIALAHIQLMSLSAFSSQMDRHSIRNCAARSTFLVAEGYRTGTRDFDKDMDRALGLYAEAAALGSHRARQFLGMWRLAHP
jgi:TPR repeat protein